MIKTFGTTLWDRTFRLPSDPDLDPFQVLNWKPENKGCRNPESCSISSFCLNLNPETRSGGVQVLCGPFWVRTQNFLMLEVNSSLIVPFGNRFYIPGFRWNRAAARTQSTALWSGVAGLGSVWVHLDHHGNEDYSTYYSPARLLFLHQNLRTFDAINGIGADAFVASSAPIGPPHNPCQSFFFVFNWQTKTETGKSLKMYFACFFKIRYTQRKGSCFAYFTFWSCLKNTKLKNAPSLNLI